MNRGQRIQAYYIYFDLIHLILLSFQKKLSWNKERIIISDYLHCNCVLMTLCRAESVTSLVQKWGCILSDFPTSFLHNHYCPKMFTTMSDRKDRKQSGQTKYSNIFYSKKKRGGVEVFYRNLDLWWNPSSIVELKMREFARPSVSLHTQESTGHSHNVELAQLDVPMRIHASAIYSLPCFCCLVPELCLTLCNPTDCSLLDSSVHEISQASEWEWVGSHFLLQEIFLAQELNPRLLHRQVDSLPFGRQGSASHAL